MRLRGARRTLLRAWIATALLTGMPTAASTCSIEGEVVQWIADYCMRRLETDDEIAASSCIHRELRRPFDDACGAKAHFKRTLCRLAIADGTRSGTADQCAADPAFRGPVVKRGGVGG